MSMKFRKIVYNIFKNSFVYTIVHSLRLRNINRGKNFRLRQKSFFDHPEKVYFGDDVFINRGCEFHVGGGNCCIKVGNNVQFGMNVVCVCVSHELGSTNQRAGVDFYQSIFIGDGVWIGANSLILPGVNIGKGSVIAAGSVVCENVDENVLVGGVPARIIKKLS